MGAKLCQLGRQLLLLLLLTQHQLPVALHTQAHQHMLAQLQERRAVPTGHQGPTQYMGLPTQYMGLPTQYMGLLLLVTLRHRTCSRLPRSHC